MAYRYYAHTLPGFGRIAWQEISRELAAGQSEHRRVGNRNEIVLFEYEGDPQRLLDLRSTEDIFFLVERITGILGDKSSLSQLQSRIQSARYLDTGLRIHKSVHGVRTKKRTTFRVVVRKVGKHSFRRIDVQRALEKGILQRYNYAWDVVPEGADLEIWLNLLDSEAIVGLRLSRETMRHRAYKLEHLPASLRPSAAFALAFLSNPQPDDVFLDPLCGAGTILIERALAGRHRLLVGGDINPVALEMARRNIGARHKPVAILRWDTTRLPLRQATIDKIVSNLPFGGKVGSHEENVLLYKGLFAQADRVLRAGGRMVLLTSEDGLMGDNLARHADLTLVQHYKVSILGRPASIYVLDRA